MKTARRFTLFALMAILALFAFVGCGKEDTIASISFKDHDPNVAIEIAPGAFDCSQYTVVVTYESGSTEQLALSEDMIEEADLFLLYQVGEHEITLSYGGAKYAFKVDVKRAAFADLSFPEHNVFTYDGETHTVEVNGELPSNAVVTYPGGNRFVNAGTYDVVAIVSCEGYLTQKLTTTVKIERAKYDMSGVRFEGKEVVYDGGTHSLAIAGTLPEGVPSPIYTIDGKTASGATDVGEYTVKATFLNDDPNYEPIPEMEATLKITPAEYTVKGVDIVFQNENGDRLVDATKIYDGKAVSFDLNGYDKLSKKLSVSFAVCNEKGEVISTSNKNTGIRNAGVYTVKVEFTIVDGKNYDPIDPLVRTFEVLKAEYPPLENVEFVSAQTTYDGAAHSITIDGGRPEGVAVSYEYYLDGVLVVDGEGEPVSSVVNAGRYTVKAVFSHEDINYKPIAPLSAVLQIDQAKISVWELSFAYQETWVYDGEAKEVTAARKPEHMEIRFEYYLDGELVKNPDGTPASSVTEVGEYTVKVFFVTNDNYAPMEPMTLTFAIVATND